MEVGAESAWSADDEKIDESKSKSYCVHWVHGANPCQEVGEFLLDGGVHWRCHRIATQSEEDVNVPRPASQIIECSPTLI